MSRKLILLPLLFPLIAQAQTPGRDSLLSYLEKNQATVHNLVDSYNRISIGWATIAATLAGVIFLTVLTWQLWGKEKLAAYIRTKTQEAIDAANNLKKANILVLSSTAGQANDNAGFLRSFFKAKNFPNVRYEHLGSEFKPISDFHYDVVFANNDDGQLDKAVIREYVHEDTLLFYFGKSSSWDFANDTPEISRKINYANSRAQIYGNLMSSLEFLELVQPKIKNV